MSNATYIKDADTIRIFDTPIDSLPDDLYIPPQAFAIWLEQFAGPLDFLLYLVKKNNFDLTETAILPITEQYLSYIKELDEAYFELAGDYLLMASTLIAIKSELLLPKSSIDEESANPKARLIRRLEEYAQIKEAATRLDGLIRLERDVFLAFTSPPNAEAMRAELPKYSPHLLVQSLLNIHIKPAQPSHTIANDLVQLPERISTICHTLSQKGKATFRQILDPSQGKLGVVVSFAAVLELIKRGLVGFGTTNTFNDDFDDDLDNKNADQSTLNATKNHATMHDSQSTENIGFAIDEQTLYWLN